MRSPPIRFPPFTAGLNGGCSRKSIYPSTTPTPALPARKEGAILLCLGALNDILFSDQ